MTMRPFLEDSALTGLAQVPERGAAVLYKHSPICDLAARTLREVTLFALAHPEVPVFLVDVIAQRELSSDLAEALDVPHASPQVVWLRDRRPVWAAAHSRISLEALESRLGEAGG